MSLLHPFLACATCMPDPGTSVSNAATNAIIFMIAIIGSVLAVVLGVIIKFALNQHRLAKLAQLPA